MGYAVLVDGERVVRLGSAEEVRDWLVTYCVEHEEDDPVAAHVQILERGPLAFISGGKLVDREQFL
jgi:hypothetical protein